MNMKPTVKQGGYVSAKDIKDVFKEMDIEIPPGDYDYLIQKLFEKSDSVERLDVNQLFAMFVDDTINFHEEGENNNNNDDYGN